MTLIRTAPTGTALRFSYIYSVALARFRLITNGGTWRKVLDSGNQLMRLSKPREQTRESKQMAGEENMKEMKQEPLSPAARLFHEPNFNVHIIAIMGCKTKIYPDVVKANLPRKSSRSD